MASKKKKKKPHQDQPPSGPGPENIETEANTGPLIQNPWFPPLFFLLIAALFFFPALKFDGIVLGSDDDPNWMLSYGNIGYGGTSVTDVWAPFNGGIPVLDQRYGIFVNPTQVFYEILPMYQARALTYMFWMVTAGIFMFYYFRHRRLPRGVALAGGGRGTCWHRPCCP